MNNHLPELAEDVIRWENLYKVHLVGPQMVLSVIASGRQKPAWGSQPQEMEQSIFEGFVWIYKYKAMDPHCSDKGEEDTTWLTQPRDSDSLCLFSEIPKKKMLPGKM